MMNIREYFDTLYMNAKTEEEFDNVAETEDEIFEWYEDDDGILFTAWAKANNIDLTTTAKVGNHTETVLTLWAWDHDDA